MELTTATGHAQDQATRKGIYWAIGIAVVVYFIMMAIRPTADTSTTNTNGGIYEIQDSTKD